MSFELPLPTDGEQTPYALVGQAEALPGMEDALTERLLALVAPTRQEAGCLEYHVHQDRAEPGRLHFYEAWASRDDLLAHLAQPYVQDFLADRQRYLRGEMQVRWLRMRSPYPA